MNWVRILRLIAPFIFGLAAVLLSWADSSALPPSERSRWMAGVGVLVGQADINTNLQIQPGWRSGITPQIRFGRMILKDRLMVNLENKQWTRERGNLPTSQPPPGVDFIKYQINSQIFALALTAFPGKPDNLSGGFYLNFGVGPAVTRVDSAVVDTLGSGEDPPEVVKYEWGWGYFAGGGYELRFIKSVAAGLSLNYVYSSIKGELINSTRSWPVALTLSWYF